MTAPAGDPLAAARGVPLGLAQAVPQQQRIDAPNWEFLSPPRDAVPALTQAFGFSWVATPAGVVTDSRPSTVVAAFIPPTVAMMAAWISPTFSP